MGGVRASRSRLVSFALALASPPPCACGRACVRACVPACVRRVFVRSFVWCLPAWRTLTEQWRILSQARARAPSDALRDDDARAVTTTATVTRARARSLEAGYEGGERRSLSERRNLRDQPGAVSERTRPRETRDSSTVR